jgi:hypothetical protein
MDERDILEKIVTENGDCSWVDGVKAQNICSTCPMSKLKPRSSGEGYLPCIEALGAERMEKEKADLKYKEAATRLLLDHSIDDLLKE